MYDALSQNDSIEKCIVHLSSTEVLYCVVKDIFKNDDEQVKQWLEENSKSCQEVQSLGEPHLVVIFKSENDGLKYDVTFASVNMLNFSNANHVYDLADEASKNDFIEKMMSYMQNNPIVDLVLPIELMNEDINLWKVKKYFTLSTKSRVNIRSYKRYNTSKDIRDLLYKSQWEEVLDKITKGKKLADISTEDDFDEKIGTNSEYCGIASKFTFGKDEWEAVLDNDELGYIVLWLTSESGKDLGALTSNLNELQKEYHKLNNKPINFMYDDPTTYYYPAKGEK